jgi:hypothetical protein
MAHTNTCVQGPLAAIATTQILMDFSHEPQWQMKQNIHRTDSSKLSDTADPRSGSCNTVAEC